jgi:hypothetical protein
VLASGLTTTTLKVSLTEGGARSISPTTGTGTHDLWKHSFTYAKGGLLHDFAYEGTGVIGAARARAAGWRVRWRAGLARLRQRRGPRSLRRHFLEQELPDRPRHDPELRGNPILVNCKFPQINTRIGAHCVLGGTLGSALFGDIQGAVVDGPRFVDEDPDGGSLWWSTNSPTIQSLLLINCKPIPA